MRVAGVAGIVGYSDSPKLRDSGPNDIAYTAAASLRSNLRVSVFTEGDSYQPGSPMKVAVAVSDLAPILGASVTALVNYHNNFVTWETLTNNVPGATWSGRLPGSPDQAFLRLRVSAQAP